MMALDEHRRRNGKDKQHMGTGHTFKEDPFVYADPVTRRSVTRLLHHRGHCNLLYFTDPYWLDGAAFVYCGDREGASNLFRYNRARFESTQLTDLHGEWRPHGTTCRRTGEHYFWYGAALLALNLRTLELRELTRLPGGFVQSSSLLSVTADARHVCTVVREDLDAGRPPGLTYLYSGSASLMERRPLTRILRVAVASGATETVYEDRCYMTHVNASPTRAALCTFCHEGPWARVDHRLWGLDLDTGAVWKIRPRQAHEAIRFGHEFWLADGERIGYHGRPRDPHPATGRPREFFGIIRYDNTGLEEHWFEGESTHFHTLDGNTLVCDGTPALAYRAMPHIMVFTRRGTGFEGPRTLATHRSSFCDQYAHPHSQITPDGRHVLWTSDLTGYSSIYTAELADLEALPPASPA